MKLKQLIKTISNRDGVYIASENGKSYYLGDVETIPKELLKATVCRIRLYPRHRRNPGYWLDVFHNYYGIFVKGIDRWEKFISIKCDVVELPTDADFEKWLNRDDEAPRREKPWSELRGKRKTLEAADTPLNEAQNIETMCEPEIRPFEEDLKNKNNDIAALYAAYSTCTKYAVDAETYEEAGKISFIRSKKLHAEDEIVKRFMEEHGYKCDGDAWAPVWFKPLEDAAEKTEV